MGEIKFTDNDIIQDYINGEKPTNIAKKYNISRATVYNKVKKYNEKLKKEQEQSNKIEQRKLELAKANAERNKADLEAKKAGAVTLQELSPEKIEDDNYLEKLFDNLNEFVDETMTDKQKRFSVLVSYGIHQNRAYVKAGYSSKQSNIGIRASELKRSPKVKAAITVLRRIINGDLEIDPKETILFHDKVRKADIMDYIDVGVEKKVRYNKKGDEYEVEVPYCRLKDLDNVDTTLIKSLKLSKEGNVELELYDKNKSEDFLAKYNGLLDNKEEDSATERGMAQAFKNVNFDDIDIDLEEAEDADIVSEDGSKIEENQEE